jgi:phosphoribosylformylglycinamidine synthase
MALRAGSGATVSVPEGVDPFVLLFSESTARAVVAVAPSAYESFLAAAATHDVPVTPLGEVTGSDDLVVLAAYDDEIIWSLDELRAASEATLPALFG